MGRPPSIPAEKKTRIVLSVLAGEITIAEAAHRDKVSEQSIGRWKADFLEAGKTALAAGRSGPSSREEQLEAEVTDLTQALGEAHVELRVWKKSAEAGWALLRPRGNSGRGGHVDHEVLPASLSTLLCKWAPVVVS
jgi:transposase